MIVRLCYVLDCVLSNWIVCGVFVCSVLLLWIASFSAALEC